MPVKMLTTTYELNNNTCSMNETPYGKEFQSMWWKLFIGDSVLSCAENSNQLHSPPHATYNIPAHTELN